MSKLVLVLFKKSQEKETSPQDQSKIWETNYPTETEVLVRRNVKYKTFRFQPLLSICLCNSLDTPFLSICLYNILDKPFFSMCLYIFWTNPFCLWVYIICWTNPFFLCVYMIFWTNPFFLFCLYIFWGHRVVPEKSFISYLPGPRLLFHVIFFQRNRPSFLLFCLTV